MTGRGVQPHDRRRGAPELRAPPPHHQGKAPPLPTTATAPYRHKRLLAFTPPSPPLPLFAQHLVKYYGLSGAGSFECVAFGNVKPFLEHFDELAPLQPPGSKGNSKQLTSRQKAQREDGIKMAMKDAKIKDKWRRAL